MPEQMQQAKELLAQKRYDEARAILVNIDDPTATKWLAKLDEIAPAPTVELPTNNGHDSLVDLFNRTQRSPITNAPDQSRQLAELTTTSNQQLKALEYALHELTGIRGELSAIRTKAEPNSAVEYLLVGAAVAAILGALWAFEYLLVSDYGSTSIWSYITGQKYDSGAFKDTFIIAVFTIRFILGFSFTWLPISGALAAFHFISDKLFRTSSR